MTTREAPSWTVLSAGTLCGESVVNAGHEKLGKIEEIMLDVPRGTIAYAVLSFGGVLGMGDKLLAIPWSALKVDVGEKHFILNADKKTLEEAPGFDKDNWPNMAAQSWAAGVFSHYGAKPTWEI
jgi:hypothetical protein